MPLAEATRRIAAVLEHFLERPFGWVEPEATRVIEGALHADAVGVATSEEGGAAGCADRLGDVKIREAGTLLGQRIDVWRADILRAEAAYVTVAEVIDQNQDDVRRAFRSEGGGGEQEQEEATHQIRSSLIG